MKRADFEANNEANWKELEAVVDELDQKRPLHDATRLPHLFRQACGDLALAQHRMYGRKLCDRLNRVVISTWGHLHTSLNRGATGLALFFGHTFPAAVRAEWRVVWVWCRILREVCRSMERPSLRAAAVKDMRRCHVIRRGGKAVCVQGCSLWS